MSPEPADVKPATGDVGLAADSPPKLPKVQLDIDDAPFLREQKAETPPPPPPPPNAPDAPLEVPAPPVEDKSINKKKKIIILAAALLALLCAGGGGTVWWFVLRTPPPPPPAPQVIVVPSAPKDSGPPADILFPIAPFWMELPGESPRNKGKIFFLVCKFTAISKSEAINQEAQSKITAIRDALYFYLKNKSYEFLTDPGNTQVIKNDLVSVINGYLANGKMDDVLFERYITK